MKLAQTLSPDNSEQILFLHKEQNIDIIVYENKEIIWLTIDGIVQTAIERKIPYRPVLPHCFIMLLPLLHDKEPQKILELGAGAMAFQRYLSCSHPNIKMTSIESSAAVIEANKRCFPTTANENLVIADAYRFVDEVLEHQSKFDWIMVDLFYGKNSPFLQDTDSFVKKLQKLINKEGWLIINMLTKDSDELAKVSQLLKSHFGKNVYLFAVPEMQNHIFLCKNDESKNFFFPSEIEQHNLA